MDTPVYLDGETLSIQDVVRVARDGVMVAIPEEAKARIAQNRQMVEDAIARGEVIYGLNTGFGKFSDVAISEEQLDELQYRLILADCVGVGRPFAEEVVRAIMALRVNALAKGCSGIRTETVETLVAMLNKRVHPIIPEKGSVGSSGDLCPLAHMVMPMLGEGEAEYGGEVLTGEEAMRRAGIPTIRLKAKEGLALINGTCAMMGAGVLAVYDARNLAKTADIAASLTLEALHGVTDAYDRRLHEARPHKGQLDVAANMLLLVTDSKMTTRQGEMRVQDAYTLRCIPQIHGASRLALDYVESVIATEINSVTDNPLIFDGDVISGGNFHGQPIAIAMDTLAIAVSELANVSERRTERLLNPALNEGLPAFLVSDGGLNCGFMVAQYSAAALVSENKILSHPASVDSIPTCANQEDHVSFGTIAARKAREIVEHSYHVLGIELICAAQGVDLREGADKLGKGSSAAYKAVRELVPFMEKDIAIYRDMNAVYGLLHHGKLVSIAETAAGMLN